MGRASEIQRDEIKFSKFIQKLRKRFASLFSDILRTQLVLKGIMTPEDWDEVKELLVYDFNDDNHFHEIRDSEILAGRVEQLGTLTEYIGTYFSKEWVRKRVLKQTDLEIEQIDAQIETEKSAGEVDQDAGTGIGGPEGGFGDPTRGVEQPPEEGDPYDDYDDMAPEV